jgi:hypothetical protein
MKTDLNKLLRTLLENKTEFVLVGGFAATVHGSSYFTKDVDICCVLSPTQIEVLREVLGPLHPKHRMTPAKLSFLEEPRNLEAVRNIYLETDLGVLDIVSEVCPGKESRRSQNLPCKNEPSPPILVSYVFLSRVPADPRPVLVGVGATR